MASVLRRDTKNGIMGGVCAGLGNYFNIDKLLIRLIFVFAFLWAGIGPLLYLILWLLIPADTDGDQTI